MQNIIVQKHIRVNPLSFGGCILWLSSEKNFSDRVSVRDWSGNNTNGTYTGSGGS